LGKLSSERYVPAYDFAVVYAGLAEYESVFGWLEKAYEEHSTWLALVNVDPRFDPFHSHPPRSSAWVSGFFFSPANRPQPQE